LCRGLPFASHDVSTAFKITSLANLPNFCSILVNAPAPLYREGRFLFSNPVLFSDAVSISDSIVRLSFIIMLHLPTKERKMKESTIEKVTAAVDRLAYFIGVCVLAFIVSTAVVLSSLTIGYGLADAVSYVTSPTPFQPCIVPNPSNVNEVCLIPPAVQNNEDPPLPEVQDVKAVSTVFIKAKVPTP
jgi:hypothetical protein